MPIDAAPAKTQSCMRERLARASCALVGRAPHGHCLCASQARVARLVSRQPRARFRRFKWHSADRRRGYASHHRNVRSADIRSSTVFKFGPNPHGLCGVRVPIAQQTAPIDPASAETPGCTHRCLASAMWTHAARASRGHSPCVSQARVAQPVSSQPRARFR